MKKISSYFVVMLLSAMSLTSCLDGNNVSEGYAFGVLGYVNYVDPVLKSTVGTVSSSNLASLTLNGDMVSDGCYYFQYSFDADLPENAASVVEAKGYSTISLLAWAEVPTYYLNSYLTDTAEVLDGELPILKVYDGSSYIENRFIISQVIKQESDLKVSWDMSYDYSTMMPTEDGSDKRYYDLFCRAYKTSSSDKTTKVDMQHVNAYRIGTYLQNVALKEKEALGGRYNASSSTFTLRFNYVSAIDENGNKTWSSTTTDIKVANFLPASE